MYQARLHIVNNILVNKCPRCRQAFCDFSNCFALSCSRCDCNFCGWCLADCGEDAHSHVLRCPHNLAGGNLFADENLFKQAMNRRRARELRRYLGKFQEAIAEEILKECATDLDGVGLTPQIIAARRDLHREADGVA